MRVLRENVEFWLPQPNYTNESLYSLKYLHNNGPISDCIYAAYNYIQKDAVFYRTE